MLIREEVDYLKKYFLEKHGLVSDIVFTLKENGKPKAVSITFENKIVGNDA